MAQRALDEWVAHQQAAGLARRTVVERAQLIRRMQEMTGCDSLTVTTPQIAGFLADPRFGPATRRCYHAHLRAWFRWLQEFGYRPDDPAVRLRPPRVPRRSPRPVTVDQLALMLAQRMHRRTRAMILLGAYEGLRVSEIAAVRGEDLRGGSLWVTGKGGVTAAVPVHRAVAEVAARMPEIGWWFGSYVNAGGHITGNAVSQIISNVMRRAGVPGTPHCLRHFFGTECLRAAGGNLVVTQQLMRHANLATTALYTDVDDTARRAAVDRLPVPLHSISGGRG